MSQMHTVLSADPETRLSVWDHTSDVTAFVCDLRLKMLEYESLQSHIKIDLSMPEDARYLVDWL